GQRASASAKVSPVKTPTDRSLSAALFTISIPPRRQIGWAVSTARTRSLANTASSPPSLASARPVASACARPFSVSGVGPWPPNRPEALPSLCPWRRIRISVARIFRSLYIPRSMPSYDKLRELVSHRVTFDYDTGARIVGYIAATKPATGPVQVLVMSRVDILDDKGRLLEHHDEF